MPPSANKTRDRCTHSAGEKTARADAHSNRSPDKLPFASSIPLSSNLPRTTRPPTPSSPSISSRNDARFSRGSTRTTSTGKQAATISPGKPAPDPTSIHRCPCEQPSRLAKATTSIPSATCSASPARSRAPLRFMARPNRSHCRPSPSSLVHGSSLSPIVAACGSSSSRRLPPATVPQ